MYVYRNKDSLDTARLVHGEGFGGGILSVTQEGIVVDLVAAVEKERVIPQGVLVTWEDIGTAQALLSQSAPNVASNPDIADCGEVADATGTAARPAFHRGEELGDSVPVSRESPLWGMIMEQFIDQFDNPPSLGAVSRLTGVSQSTLRRWREGRAGGIPDRLLQRLCDTLDWDSPEAVRSEMAFRVTVSKGLKERGLPVVLPRFPRR